LDQLKEANPDTIYSLSLAKLKLDSVPMEIAQFKNLLYLDLSKNRLSELPEFLSDFKDLEYVDISKNKFETFPLVLTQLEKLKSLLANRNLFDRIPESIEYNRALETLDLWDTPVMYFPESFYSLPNLKKLDLSGIRYSPDFQQKLISRLPLTKIVFDAPCDCLK
jgi:Leucine-rich repeat (LRR) protein